MLKLLNLAALHFIAMSTLLPCILQKASNQSAQYARLGQWTISPFENVNAFD